MSVRVARAVLWTVLPLEVALLVLLVGGVRIPAAALAVVEALVVGALLFEAGVLLWRYTARRRAGAGAAEALRAGVGEVVPRQVGRLLVHEVRALHSLALWLVRRRHRLPAGATAAGYTGPQTATMWALVLVSLVETVVLALVIPWPTVHRVLLVVDVYGVVLVLALHAACVTRPHVVGADGSLRLRHGALFDLRLPPEAIASVRVERRYQGGKSVGVEGDLLELAVGGQTSVTVELAEPVAYVRPLGGTGRARTVRFHADDAQACVAALRRSPEAAETA